MTPLIILAVAALHSSPISSQEWVFTGASPDTGFAVDKASMRQSGTGVIVWVLAIPLVPQTSQYGGSEDYNISQIRYDCETGVIRVNSRVVYGLDGTVGQTSQSPANAEGAPAPPGTVGANITRRVCQSDGLDGLPRFNSAAEVRNAYRQQDTQR